MEEGISIADGKKEATLKANCLQHKIIYINRIPKETVLEKKARWIKLDNEIKRQRKKIGRANESLEAKERENERKRMERANKSSDAKERENEKQRECMKLGRANKSSDAKERENEKKRIGRANTSSEAKEHENKRKQRKREEESKERKSSRQKKDTSYQHGKRITNRARSSQQKQHTFVPVADLKKSSENIVPNISVLANIVPSSLCHS